MIDTLLAQLQQAHGAKPSLVDPVSPGWLDPGRKALADAARRLNLWTRFAAGKCTPAQCRAILAAVIDTSRSAIGSLAARFAAGIAAPSSWVASSLKSLIPGWMAGTLAIQNATDLDDPSRRDLFGEIRVQAGYLGRFRRQVESGETPMKDRDGNPSAAFVNRMRMYADAAHGLSYQVDRLARMRAGFRSEARQLHAKVNCQVCLDEAAKGFRPIGSLRRLGDSPCRTHCRCVFIYRR